MAAKPKSRDFPGLSRCPFPGCQLWDEHDGEHKVGRPEVPIAPLRKLQGFSGGPSSPFCQMGCAGGIAAYDSHGLIGRDNFRRADALYADAFGFGWELCEQCATKYGRSQDNE